MTASGDEEKYIGEHWVMGVHLKEQIHFKNMSRTKCVNV